MAAADRTAPGDHGCRVYTNVSDAIEAARSSAAFRKRAYLVMCGTETITTVTPPDDGR